MVSLQDTNFVVSLVVNVVLAVLFFSLFLFFRKRVPQVYEPRCLKAGDGIPSHRQDTIVPSPPGGPIGWITNSIRYNDDMLFDSHGIDAVMYLSFLRTVVFIVACQLIYGVVVLFVVNVVASTGESGRLNAISLANVPSGSPLLGAHLVSVVVNTALIFFFMFRNYKEYIRFRVRYKALPAAHNYTVMFREITPTHPFSVLSRIEGVLPGHLAGYIPALTVPALDKMLTERAATLRKLEKARTMFHLKGERPVHKTKFLIGNKVDSIDTYTAELADLDTKIEAQQSENKYRIEAVAGTVDNFSGTGFVVLDNSVSANLCSRGVFDASGYKFRVCSAPEPEDVHWRWLGVSHMSRFIRTTIVNIFIFFLVFFWLIPVTFVSALTTLENLAKVPGLDFLVRLLSLSPVIVGFIQGFLPSLALIIFMIILIPIITAVARIQGLPAQSDLARSVFSKYYVFNVVNVFLGITIGGSIFKVLDQIAGGGINTVVDLLAHSLPQQATFFINYLMILSLSGHFMSLWRPGPLIVRWLKLKWLAKTPKERRAAEDMGQFPYATSLAKHILVFLIVLTYSTISPFILLFGCVYFALAFISSRYNIIHVHHPLYEGGGNMWPSTFNRVMVAALIYQLTLIGVFSSYLFPAGAAVTAVCLVATIIYWRKMHFYFSGVAEYGSLDHKPDDTEHLLKKKKAKEKEALRIEVAGSSSEEHEGAESSHHASPLHGYVAQYRQPSLLVPDEVLEVAGGGQMEDMASAAPMGPSTGDDVEMGTVNKA